MRMVMVLVGLLCSFIAAAQDHCFIAIEDGKIVKEEGHCDKRHSPFSTFKIALAIMGYDAGILESSEKPLIIFDEQQKKKVEPWYNPQKYPIQLFYNRDHTPHTWMHYSVIWYSQYITEQLGMKKFQDYAKLFSYGNENVLGDPIKKDGLLSAWLQSSLLISPKEQVYFLEKLSQKKLPVSELAQTNTIRILKLENMYDDWELYGKTGGGKKEGWFVGWIEKENRRIVFTQYIALSEDGLISAGRLGKELAKDNLITLIL